MASATRRWSDDPAGGGGRRRAWPAPGRGRNGTRRGPGTSATQPGRPRPPRGRRGARPRRAHRRPGRPRLELQPDDRGARPGSGSPARTAGQAPPDDVADALREPELLEAPVTHHLPSRCSIAPDSARWRSTSATKNGLPSVSRHTAGPAPAPLSSRPCPAAGSMKAATPARPGRRAPAARTARAPELGQEVGERDGAADVGVPVGDHDQEPQRLREPQDVAQQQQRGFGRPVQVVEHEQDGRLGRDARPARRSRPRRGGSARSPGRTAAARGAGDRAGPARGRRGPARRRGAQAAARAPRGRRSGAAPRRTAGTGRRGPRRSDRRGRRAPARDALGQLGRPGGSCRSPAHRPEHDHPPLAGRRFLPQRRGGPAPRRAPRRSGPLR